MDLAYPPSVIRTLSGAVHAAKSIPPACWRQDRHQIGWCHAAVLASVPQPPRRLCHSKNASQSGFFSRMGCSSFRVTSQGRHHALICNFTTFRRSAPAKRLRITFNDPASSVITAVRLQKTDANQEYPKHDNRQPGAQQTSHFGSGRPAKMVPFQWLLPQPAQLGFAA